MRRGLTILQAFHHEVIRGSIFVGGSQAGSSLGVK